MEGPGKRLSKMPALEEPLSGESGLIPSNIISGEASSPEKEKWETRRGLATRFGVDFGTISNLVNEYRELHPEWIYHTERAGNVASERYAPALAELLQDRLGEREPAPEGWKTNLSIATEI